MFALGNLLITRDCLECPDASVEVLSKPGPRPRLPSSAQDGGCWWEWESGWVSGYRFAQFLALSGIGSE